MPRHLLRSALLALTLAACAQTQSPPTTGASATDAPPVTAVVAPAPTAPASAAPAPSAVAAAPDAAAPSSAPSDLQSGVDAKYRACAAATDCIAVEPVGCCHNGQMVAVAAKQKAAYFASFTCPQKRPMCPMYHMMPDGRVPACESSVCVLKAP